jgi:hypothetical protein
VPGLLHTASLHTYMAVEEPSVNRPIEFGILIHSLLCKECVATAHETPVFPSSRKEFLLVHGRFYCQNAQAPSITWKINERAPPF